MQSAKITTERQLAAICRALLPPSCELTLQEWSLLKGNVRNRDCPAVQQLREAIERGADPLGDAFVSIRSAEERRSLGATYTPSRIVEAMIRWASKQDAPSRVIDPGSGSGKFILAAADAFPKAQLVAVEQDPLAALTLRANLAVRGLSDRAEVLVDDFCTAPINQINGRTLFVGNPPYVRHHKISRESKKWFGQAAAELGISASKLAGLHIYFFFRTALIAKMGDFGAYVTASEWLDVNYGSSLRDLLSGDRLNVTNLHTIDPKTVLFDDAMTTGTITCFQSGSKKAQIRVQFVSRLDELNALGGGTMISNKVTAASARWSTLKNKPHKAPANFMELGEVFRVHRGQVTGGNSIWIAGVHSQNLPPIFMFPTVTKGRELRSALTPGQLRRVIDLPADLDQVSKEQKKAILQFLRYAKDIGAHESYTAQHRKAWWSVGLRQPAPILAGYMARGRPAFARNRCGARHINIAHGLYPREPIGSAQLDKLVEWLSKNVRAEDGRIYAGGLIKFEPAEVERILIPPLEAFR